MKKIITTIALILTAMISMAQYSPSKVVNTNLNIYGSIWNRDTIRGSYIFMDSVVSEHVYADTSASPAGYFTTIYNTDLFNNYINTDSVVSTYLRADTSSGDAGYFTDIYNTNLYTNNVVSQNVSASDTLFLGDTSYILEETDTLRIWTTKAVKIGNSSLIVDSNGNVTITGNATADTLIGYHDPGYKVYVALLTQSDTNAPVATILQNTLNSTPSYKYNNVGDYYIVDSNQFAPNKTIIYFGQSINTGSVGNAIITVMGDAMTENSIEFLTYDSSATTTPFVPNNNILYNTFIEIRVYP